MKELITFVLKPLSFLPALAIMYIIYSFSGQTGEESGNLSYEVSVKIVEIGNQVLDKGLQDWEISEVAASIEYPVRKLAHMSEYFILAVAVSFPFYVYGLRGFPLMVVAGLICVGFAAGDEYHQSFVDGRGPSVIDVGIDSIGVFFGILTVRIVCFIFLAPARMLERRRHAWNEKMPDAAALPEDLTAPTNAVLLRQIITDTTLQNLGNIPLPESAVAMMMCSMMNTMIHSMTMIIMRTITKRKIIEKPCAPPGNEEQTLLPQETSLWKTNGLETILKSSLAMK